MTFWFQLKLSHLLMGPIEMSWAAQGRGKHLTWPQFSVNSSVGKAAASLQLPPCFPGLSFMHFSPGEPAKSHFPRLGELGLCSRKGPNKQQSWELVSHEPWWMESWIVARIVLNFPPGYSLGIKVLLKFLSLLFYTLVRGLEFFRLFVLRLSTFSWVVTDKYSYTVWGNQFLSVFVPQNIFTNNCWLIPLKSLPINCCWIRISRAIPAHSSFISSP